MNDFSWLILVAGGLISGVIAGLLGIGGGIITIPLLVTLGYTPVQAIATSSLAIVITSISGSIQNWWMGYFDFKRVIYLGIPAFLTTGIGVYFANKIPPYIILFSFGIILLANIYLIDLRKQLASKTENENTAPAFNPLLTKLGTGGAAGILAGLFGLGGGTIMVPLQILLLGEEIKVAIQTSLGVIVITALAACTGHTLEGNILFFQGIILGCGGLIGVQMSTRTLPKIPDSVVSFALRIFLGILSIYIFWEAWINYQLIA
ncbi:sulfite exporter TauE/SafE family protein [Komarekiella sp. 'clone 1']|uniref:Probable membrane transporter protein n=1 Tax=Komarekiella delphini-convector SJRDD-AB1 TaxID=2593771 RepID=A0AA40T070_9NOST|nr:sulfite exporter TauE/SafE family protein [Komarekiella delphini-convector]MBD6618543.1 sulfite exporter TauE/SafE family protein [Komarekiella delphini-convector SJRDD-AB1]